MTPRHWIAVACAEHVARGVAGGFMQVCHGKRGPLARIRPGDWVACYSPSRLMGRADGLHAFTALGTVRAGEVYAHDMGGGFMPWRRDVDWRAAQAAPIRPLLPLLRLTAGRAAQWGAVFRFGLVAIEPADAQQIAQAMQAAPPRAPEAPTAPDAQRSLAFATP